MTRYFTRVHTFYCDEEGCNESFEEIGLTAHDSWTEARGGGWRERRGGHRCPEHASKPMDQEADRG